MRESRNIKTLANIGYKAICVPDPSQILTKSDYLKLIKSANLHPQISDGKVRTNAIFTYILGNETIADKDEILRFLSEKNELIFTNGNLAFNCEWDFTSDFAPSPVEWLLCVNECRAVVTNSFHGTAYAIVMNTPFVALKINDDGQNVRFEQLLRLFGLEHLLVSNLAEFKAAFEAAQNIDFDAVNSRLKAWQDVGVAFLRENLADV